MRRAAFAVLLFLAPRVGAQAQSPVHEYRPEIVVTLPRVNGYGLQFLLEQHLETSTLAPNERIQGVGVSSPIFYEPFGARFVMEVRQVIMPTVTEHRYIPTINTAIPVGAGFEVRSRTRAEVRDINRDWSVRWQDRSALGHDVHVGGVAMFVYGQVDFSYDSRVSTINRTEQTVGSRISVLPGTSVDLFFMRQADTRRAEPLVFASGAIIRIAL